MAGFSKTLKLIGCYLNQKEDKDLIFTEQEASFLWSIGHNHSIAAFLHKAIEFHHLALPEPIKKKFEEAYMQNVRKHVFFQKEKEALYAFLDEQAIDYLPLKGLVLKDLYFDPYEREFADHDILFLDPKKDSLIHDYFLKAGYECESYRKGNHDVYLKKPFLNFEMHRSLFSPREDTEAFYTYFKDISGFAVKKENHEYYLKDEDFYLYFLAHAHKHYAAGGNGLRMLIDCYLFLKGRELDRSYLKDGLEKLGLIEFESMLSSLCFHTFDGASLSDQEKETLLYIGKSGTYGTVQHSVEKGVKKKGKFAYFMSRVFPPMSFYKEAYPWAYKTVILIPIAWLMRFFRILFKNPGRAARELKEIKNAKKD